MNDTQRWQTIANQGIHIERELRAEIEWLRRDRSEIIEECARVAEGFGDEYSFLSSRAIAAAIRALKDRALKNKP